MLFSIENEVGYLFEFLAACNERYTNVHHRSNSNSCNEQRAVVVNKHGEEIIAPQYEEASDFYEGRAAVRLNSKYGAIDKRGEIVVPLIHDKIGMHTTKIWVDE